MSDDWLTVIIGDNRVILDTLPERSVHCVITSPPYWGLRDYGTPDQLGLEATPEEYVAAMVDVFRKVRRVLRDDGTVWLNLGDSYANDGKWGGSSGGKHVEALHGQTGIGRQKVTTGLKPKDLVGIPWRVAFALQADGWYLRSDIIWSKPNPMPESVTDRPTKSHEYVFLLAKSARYYFDQEAVREPNVSPEQAAHTAKYAKVYDAHTERVAVRREGVQPNNVNNVGIHARGGATVGRNIRSVWTIATQPYPGAHFAVFPPALVEPCVKAGTSERGVCGECGAPWERVVEVLAYPKELRAKPGDVGVKVGYGDPMVNTTGTGQKMQNWRDANPPRTTGWRPSCAHDAPTVPATVLDPFAGSGTTGVVANKLSRRAILIDLNPEYGEQIMKRTAQAPLGLVG